MNHPKVLWQRVYMRVRITLFLFFCGLLWGGGLKQTEAAEPVGWWKLNETTGSIAYDSSGNGFNGTVNLGGGSAIWQPGGFDSNGCANFTAKQYVRIPNGVWDLIGDQMSIAFWVNQDPNHPPGSNWPGPWGCARTPGLTWPQPNWLQLRRNRSDPGWGHRHRKGRRKCLLGAGRRQRLCRQMEPLCFYKGRQRPHAYALPQRG